MDIMETFLIDKNCMGVGNLNSFMFDMLTDGFIGQPDESQFLHGSELDQNITNLLDTEDFYVLKVNGKLASYVSIWISKIPMKLFDPDDLTLQNFTTLTVYTTPEFRGQGYTEQLLDYVVNLRNVEVYFCKWNNQRSRNLAFNQDYQYVGDFDNYGELYALFKTDHCPY